MFQAPKKTLSKLDVAHRQLRTAIILWFNDGDEVSIHTLACAAYQIIHDLNKKRGGPDLIYNNPMVKEDYRGEINQLLKKDANFFKHADRDADGSVEFAPLLSQLFLMGCLIGLENLKITRDATEGAFYVWFALNNPYILSEEGLKTHEKIPAEALREFMKTPKMQFLNLFKMARLGTIDLSASSEH